MRTSTVIAFVGGVFFAVLNAWIFSKTGNRLNAAAAGMCVLSTSALAFVFWRGRA
jgi:uncharacterized membrane protein YqjE